MNSHQKECAETKALTRAIEDGGYQIVQELPQSSNYARSFKAVKGASVFCIKTLDTRAGGAQANQVELPAALVKMSREVAGVSIAFERISRTEPLYQDIASIEATGSWTSPGNRLSVPWYAQRWIEGPELASYWPEKVRALEGQQFFDTFLVAARGLLELVGFIHDYQVAHGDIWQKNIKVRLDEDGDGFRLALIDFAECFFPEQHTANFATPTGRNARSNRVIAPEERKGRKVSFQTDIYHIGETLLFLASKGTYAPRIPNDDPSEIWRMNLAKAAEELESEFSKSGQVSKKRILEFFVSHEGVLDRSAIARSQRDSLKTEVENIVDRSLMNLVPGVIDVILLCKVDDLNLRASSIFEVRNLLETYARANKGVGPLEIEESSDRLSAMIREHRQNAAVGRGRSFLTQMLALELERVRWRFKTAMRTQIYEITGERGDCIQGLLDFLSLLQPGDQYIATTIPSLWTSRGLGNEGRFYRLNLEMAINKIAIKRLFIVEKGSMNRFPEYFPKQFGSQKRFVSALRDAGVYASSGRDFENQSCFVGVAEVEKGQLDQWDTAGFNVGLARFKDGGKWNEVQLYIRPTKEYLRRLDLKYVDGAKALNEMKQIFSNAVSIDDEHAFLKSG